MLDVLVAFALTAGAPQAPVATPPPADVVAQAVTLVAQWIERLNALDGTPATRDAFVDLHADDALFTTGPNPDQRGTVVYRGHDGIGKMAADLAAAYERFGYRIEGEMANEDAAQLFHVTTGPWGGPAIAIQLVAVATSRSDGKRFATPGAAFFQVREGRIRRVRLYLAQGERSEVEPDQRRRP